MPYVNNHGVQIYYEVEGLGPPIMLAHGGAGDISYWRGYGYVDRLIDKYKVILFDARGHGRSDKPHAVEAYAPEKMVEDAVLILDALKIDAAHFWGYSMGSFTGISMAYRYPERTKSVIVGGGHPYELDGSGLQQIWQLGIAEGADAVVKAMQTEMTVSPQFEARLRSLDFHAQSACIQGASKRKSLAAYLPNMKTPFLFYAGDQEDGYPLAQRAAQILPDAQFFGLPNLDHGSTSAAVDLIMPKVKTFLAQIP
jgi:pimeloyl-ACP methyl ester carboxylesterase